jgi:hypothetical protein
MFARRSPCRFTCRAPGPDTRMQFSCEEPGPVALSGSGRRAPPPPTAGRWQPVVHSHTAAAPQPAGPPLHEGSHGAAGCVCFSPPRPITAQLPPRWLAGPGPLAGPGRSQPSTASTETYRCFARKASWGACSGRACRTRGSAFGGCSLPEVHWVLKQQCLNTDGRQLHYVPRPTCHKWQ